jgi:hypothetical protein
MQTASTLGCPASVQQVENILPSSSIGVSARPSRLGSAIFGSGVTQPFCLPLFLNLQDGVMTIFRWSYLHSKS